MQRWKQVGALALFLGVGGGWVGWAGCGSRVAPPVPMAEGVPSETAPTQEEEGADVVLPSSKAFVPPPGWAPPPEKEVVLPSSKAALPIEVLLPSTKAAAPPGWAPPPQPVLLPSSKAGALGLGGSVEGPATEIEVEKLPEGRSPNELDEIDPDEVDGDIEEQDPPEPIESEE